MAASTSPAHAISAPQSFDAPSAARSVLSATLLWTPRVAVAAIFAIGALPKFTGGSGALANVLPGGAFAVTTIGLAEVVAIALILTPRTALVGTGLATALMVGAVGSHVVGPVGLDGELGALFPMAVIALLAAVVAVVTTLRSRR